MWGDVVDLTLLIACWNRGFRLEPAEHRVPTDGIHAGRVLRFFQALIDNVQVEQRVGDLAAPLVADGTIAERVARCRLAGSVLRLAADSPRATKAPVVRRPKRKRRR